jgi:hypothetical protein
MSYPGEPLQHSLNRLAGLDGSHSLDAAANAYAGTNGLSAVGALNVLAGTNGLSLAAVLNKLAGTDGSLSADEAARKIGA